MVNKEATKEIHIISEYMKISTNLLINSDYENKNNT